MRLPRRLPHHHPRRPALQVLDVQDPFVHAACGLLGVLLGLVVAMLGGGDDKLLLHDQKDFILGLTIEVVISFIFYMFAQLPGAVPVFAVLPLLVAAILVGIAVFVAVFAVAPVAGCCRPRGPRRLCGRRPGADLP